MNVPRRPGFVALGSACALGAVAVGEVALRTTRGAQVDRDVFVRVSGYGYTQVEAVGQRGLDALSATSAAAVVFVLVGLALASGRERSAVAALAMVVASVGSTELLKHVLPRLGLESARTSWQGTFPSGHATLAAALGLALLAAVPPPLKPAAALVGALYAAAVGAALVLLGWHLPSDVVGGYLVAGAWTSLVLLVSGGSRVRSPFSGAALTLTAVLALGGAVVAGLVASHHPAIAAQTLSSGALIASFGLFAAVSVTLFAGVAFLAGEEPAR